jgi:hypothetical protein
MSEITFVNRLGDALEAAVAHAPRRSRFRRHLGAYLAVGALAAAGTAAAAAGLLGGEKQAAASVGCYTDGSLSGNVAVVWAGDESPVAVCAEVLRADGAPVPPLVACAHADSVAVIPGRGDRACAAAGLSPLGGAYEPARAKVAALERELIALERSADCLAPGDLARRVQAVLDRRGWTGWTTRVRDEERGSCGSVSGLGGDGRRSLAGALDAEHRVVLVFSGPSFAVSEALYGTEGLAGPLMDASGSACFTVEELTALADRRLARAALRVGSTSTAPLPAGTELMGTRGERYAAGCAVIDGVVPGPDQATVTLQVAQTG